MKRTSESDTENSKRQKIVCGWELINQELHEKHLKEYGFSVGNTKTLNDETLGYGYSNLICTCTKDSIISDIEFSPTRSPAALWYRYSINVKNHWSEKFSYCLIPDNELPTKKYLTSVDFSQKSTGWVTNNFDGWTYLKPSQNRENGDSWILSHGDIIYGKLTHNATFLRDLKLDRKLPIQELFNYLTIEFNITASILESLFWCNHRKRRYVPPDQPLFNPARRLVWNCADLK